MDDEYSLIGDADLDEITKELNTLVGKYEGEYRWTYGNGLYFFKDGESTFFISEDKEEFYTYISFCVQEFKEQYGNKK